MHMRRSFHNRSQRLSVRFHGADLFVVLVCAGTALLVLPATGAPPPTTPSFSTGTDSARDSCHEPRTPSVTESLQLLTSTNVNERLQAAFALAFHSPTTNLTEYLSAIRPHLRDKSGPIRLNIAKALAWAIPDDVREEALRLLSSFVCKPDTVEWQDIPAYSRKMEAIYCIDIFGRLGLRAKSVVPALIRLLKNDDLHLPLRAIEALGQIGTAESVTALFNSLGSTNQFIRGYADAALERSLVPSDEAACSVAIGSLESTDVRTRMLASVTLGRAPPNLPPVIRALHKTIMTDTQAVQDVAILSLSRHSSPEAAASMTDILEKNKNPHIRDRAAVILQYGEMATNAVLVMDFVPRLVRASAAEEYGLARSGIYTVLDSLGSRQWPTNCVGTVVPLLTNANPRVRSIAAFALGGLGPQAREAIPPLRDRLNDSDDFTCDKVRQALERIGPVPAASAGERLDRPIEIGERIWVCYRKHLVVSPETEQTISPQGEITLPRLGKVHIAGLHRKDAERMIEKMYVDSGFYRKLEIAVIRDEESSNQASQVSVANAPQPER